MKRYGNLYKEICSMENLRRAHQNAKKGKGWLKHCDSYRLQGKYIAPIQAETDRYYQEVILQKSRKAA